MTADAGPVAIIVALLVGVPIGALVTWFAHGWAEGDDELSVRVPTACTGCGARIAPVSVLAVPAALWMILRPGCATCGTARPASWWVAPVAVPAGWAITLGTLGWGSWTPAMLWLVVVLVAASVVDLRLMLIPRHIVYVGLAVAAVLIVASTVIDGKPADLLAAALGGLACFLFLFLFHAIAPGGMGFGDVRLALLLGTYLGWVTPVLMPIGILFGCLFGIVFALVARAGFRSPFPFGPGLALGTLVALWFHEGLLDVLMPMA